jgi:hypothetical protein
MPVFFEIHTDNNGLETCVMNLCICVYVKVLGAVQTFTSGNIQNSGHVSLSLLHLLSEGNKPELCLKIQPVPRGKHCTFRL